MRKKRENDTRAPHRNTKQANKKTNGRRCRLCSKDSYPNYFFCPDCHSLVSRLARMDDTAESKTWRLVS